MNVSYKFRMYPNKEQTAILEDTLETCRRLWNAALADRKNTYKETGKGRTYNQQATILTIEKKGEGQYKSFTYPQAGFKLEDNHLPKIAMQTAIGVDVGLKHMVAISNGEYIEYPEYYYQTEKKLADAQGKLSRKKKGSSNYREAKRKVAGIHKHIANQRADFSHKVSRKLIDMADVVVFEDLNIQNMLKNHQSA